MEYTEEQKQEADSICKKYLPHVYCYLGSGMLTNTYNEDVANKEATHCAIQDRQSVLDLAKVAIQTCIDEHDEFWQNEIQSLNNQIEYLKSKL